MENNNKAKVGEIPYETLKEMHKTYCNGKKKLLDASLGKSETASIWFQMAEFRLFLENLLSDRNISGIRTYFGVYDHHCPPPNSIHIGNLTVGFVGTVYNPATGKHEDYHTSETNERKLVFFVGPDAYNHGKICPPEICP